MDNSDSFSDYEPIAEGGGVAGKKISKTIAMMDFEFSLTYTKEDPYYYIENRDLTREEFRHVLDVYTNNQDYYLEVEQYDKLEGLEHWFIHIIEPRPVTNDFEEYRYWFQRELAKKSGYSYSCCNEAKKKFSLKKSELIYCFRDLEITSSIFSVLKKRNMRKRK